MANDYKLKERFSYSDKKYANRFNLNQGSRDNRRFIYKYMTIENFKLSIDFYGSKNKQTFFFVEPTKWADKFEQRFYLADYGLLTPKPNAVDIPRVYACCFTTSNNSDAAWYVYRNTQKGNEGLCVKLKLRRDKLCEQLCAYGQRSGFEFNVFDGCVDYDLDDSQIKFLHQKERPFFNGTSTKIDHNPLYDLFFKDGINLDKYLNLMMIKRSIFDYENEFRMFLVDNPAKKDKAKLPSKSKNIVAEVNWNEFLVSVEVDTGYSKAAFEELKEWCISELNMNPSNFNWESHNNMKEDHINIDPNS